MSEFALNVNLYDIIRRYSDLIENVLLSIKSSSTSIDSEEGNQLINFLKKLIDKNNVELSIKLISSVLSRNLKWKDSEKVLENLIKKLEASHTDEETINQLENIADILDKECVQAISRIRGNF